MLERLNHSPIQGQRITSRGAWVTHDRRRHQVAGWHTTRGAAPEVAVTTCGQRVPVGTFDPSAAPCGGCQ